MRITIRTYQELKEFVELFKNKKIDILIIISEAGLGKTETITKELEGIDYLYLTGHITPYMLFAKSYEYKDKSIVIDDIDNILDNADILSLIKQLSDTRENKIISWNSAKKIDDGIPYTFTTKSNIMLIGNSINQINSIIDRGFYVNFIPTKEEILKKIEEIAEKNDKHKEIMKIMQDISYPTLRLYKKALVLYEKDNWQDIIIKSNWKEKMSKKQPKKIEIVERIINELPKNQWINAWLYVGGIYGWTRQNFYYYLNKLKQDDLIEEFKKSVQLSNIGKTIGQGLKNAEF